jgi:hypothetical protein
MFIVRRTPRWPRALDRWNIDLTNAELAQCVAGHAVLNAAAQRRQRRTDPEHRQKAVSDNFILCLRAEFVTGTLLTSMTCVRSNGTVRRGYVYRGGPNVTGPAVYLLLV